MRLKRIFWTPQFLRFGLIGAANTVIHGMILTVLIEFFLLNVVFSNLFGFLVANIFSYFLNSYVTFKVSPTFFLYLKFLCASLLSLALTLGIAWAMDYFGFNYREGFSVIVIVVPAVSFIVMKFWAFSAKHKSAGLIGENDEESS